MLPLLPGATFYFAAHDTLRSSGPSSDVLLPPLVSSWQSLGDIVRTMSRRPDKVSLHVEASLRTSAYVNEKRYKSREMLCSAT